MDLDQKKQYERKLSKQKNKADYIYARDRRKPFFSYKDTDQYQHQQNKIKYKNDRKQLGIWPKKK